MNYFQMKKLFLMSIVNKVKGFLRSVSGTPPITLEDCVDEESVMSYQLYGNSVQDGEPSPDNPVEVVSVGEKTRNLFDKNNVGKNAGYLNETGEVVNSGGWYHTDYIEVNSEAATISNINGYAPSICGYDENKNFISGKKYNSKNKVTIISTSTMKYVRFSYTSDNLNAVQLEHGDTATEYEPYGYKIPVTVHGENEEPITTNIYLNEPLRAFGDYKDYIDFENGKIVRNIFKSTIQKTNGNTVYWKGTNVVRIGGHIPSPIQKIGCNQMLSNILKCKPGWYLEEETIFHHATTGINYYFSFLWARLGLTYDGTNAYKTSDTTQTALSNKEILDVVFEYINSLPENDKKLYMVLNEPTEETINLSNLPTFKGNTTYTIDTTIQPTNMVVNYYSTTKGE